MVSYFVPLSTQTTNTQSLNVTGSAKRGLIADPNQTHLESHNLTCEFSTTLKLGPNILKVIASKLEEI